MSKLDSPVTDLPRSVMPTHQHASVRTPQAVKASACGKAIIVGEHAVVYGARAVAMPVLSLRFSIDLKPSGALTAGQAAVRLLFGGRPVPDHLQGVVLDAFEVLGISPFSVDLEASSSVLIGAGLGSSASLCIAVLKAIATGCGKTLTRTELATMGNCLERRFHGNPSGLDTAVVACEEVISFVKGQAPQTACVSRVLGGGNRREPWRFALLDSGVRSSTAAMIQIAAPYFTCSRGTQHIERFDRLAAQTLDGLATGSTLTVADAMNEAAAHLDEAGVVNPELRELIHSARTLGALAAKPTGAGGGGCVLALLDPIAASTQLAALGTQLGASRVTPVELA